MAKKKKNRDDDDELLGMDPISAALAMIAKPKKIRKRGKRDRQRFDDDFDAIYAAYTDPKKRDSLSMVQKRQLVRWKFARQWFSEFDPKNDAEVVEALRAEYAICSKQAYTDVANCKRFFASIDKVNMEFEKVMMIERVKRRMKQMAQVPDGFGYPSYMKAEKLLADVMGLTKEEQTLPEPKIAVVMMTANPLELGYEPIENLDRHLKAFWKKKEEEQEIEDAEYEEIETVDELIANPRNERQHQRTR